MKFLAIPFWILVFWVSFRFGILTTEIFPALKLFFWFIGFGATFNTIVEWWEKHSRKIRSDEIALWQKQNPELSLKNYQKMSRNVFDKFCYWLLFID